jgi:LacI family transcriptional regulator
MAKRSASRLTIADVAAAAQVSTMTVSRVLNDQPGVAPETRARVARVIAESGFVRNRAARALKHRHTGVVDLVVPKLDSAHILEIMRGVEDMLAPTPLRLAVSATHREERGERQWLAKVADGGTDGAILVLARGQSAQLDELRRRRIPFVVVDHRGELAADTPSVGATNWSGACQATDYLLSLGHRRLAFIGGPPSFGCSRERQSGYRAALDAAQIPTEQALIREGDFSQEAGYAAARALLALPAPPTAIVAGNDMQALGVYAALRERGLSAPDDMSVVGFDDIPFAALAGPPLTTVRQPLAEMGRVAAEMLLTLIDGAPLASPRIELATALIVRASCAAPRAAPPAGASASAAAGVGVEGS